MAKINNTAAYAISSPIDGSDIVIGSALGVGGNTKNFQMSDISAYVMSVNTLTLQDVCDNGSTTTTGITVNGVLDANSTADISGNTTIGGKLGVTGVTTLTGALDANSTADIADTLTLSKVSGTGLQVDADANISGRLIVDGNITANGFLDIVGGLKFNSPVPLTSSSSGSVGTFAVDTTHIYVCTATNTWGRVAIDTTPF